MITTSQGNTELLKFHKTAFLCSRKVSASAVLKYYDWAIAQREEGINRVNKLIVADQTQLKQPQLKL